MGFFIPALIAGASALAGVLGNKGSKTTTSNTGQVDKWTYNNFAYDGKTENYRNALMNEFTQRALNPNDLQGLQDSLTYKGLNNINDSFDSRSRIMANLAAAHGIRGAGAVSPVLASETGRLNQQVGLLNDIPLQLEQIKQQRLNDAAKFFGLQPYNSSQHTYGTDIVNGSQTTQGNPLGGGATGLAASLAYLYGSGAFKTPAADGTVTP